MSGVFKLDFDTYESSQKFDTGVLHSISSRIDLRSHFGKNAYFVNISKDNMLVFWEIIKFDVFDKLKNKMFK